MSDGSAPAAYAGAFPSRSPPVIVLHGVGLDDSGYSIDQRALEAFLSRACDEGWTILPVSEVLELARTKRGVARACGLSFDDAYATVKASALPVLRAFGVRATVFVNTEAVGRTNEWNRRARVRLQHCSWAELVQLADAGWEIGSHGHRHFNLLALTDDEVREDLERSLQLLKERLGVAPVSFAYPYGAFDARVRQVVAQYFQQACATDRGGTCLGCDRHSLRRVWPALAPPPLADFF